MADKRPFAKIDVGYYLNKKWFEIERAMRTAMPNAMPSAMRNAMRVVKEAHHASILYACQGATDGVFPVQAVKSIIGVIDEEEDAALTYLFDSGMWISRGAGMAEVRDFLEHQTDSSQVKARSDAAKKAAEARWRKDANRNADGNAERNAIRNAEKKRKEEKIINSDFDAWYASYPRKAKRADALSAFKAARKKICQEDLVDATKAYAKSVEGKDKQYVRYPATWLRAESWLDEVEAPASTPVYDPWEANRI